jgi:ribosomal protein L24
MAKIKRDDEVIVIAGRDKGKRGTVRQGPRHGQAGGLWYQHD